MRQTRNLYVLFPGESKGLECKVYYNYIPPYGMGRMPCNCWYAYSRLVLNKVGYIWEKSFGEDIESIKEAADFIRPFFRKIAKKYTKKKYTKLKLI